jgi:sigma-B regulation protein RsbU (phosphoserine phosphatase)
MQPGDTLVLYTDGITEAENAEDEEYGLDRLIEICRKNCTLPVVELARAIEQDLDAFVRGRPYADDRTLVFIRREDT